MDFAAIQTYITQARERGDSREATYLHLLGLGALVADIERAYGQLQQQTIQAARHQDTQQRTVAIIVTIGAIFVGAGVFSFIASNWQEMSKVAKLALIIAGMLASYAAAWWLGEQQKLVRLSEALYLLGCIIYGAGIFLVAQMFNIRAHWPDGFIVWMIGTLALAYVVPQRTLVYLALALSSIAIGGHPFILPTTLPGHNPFLLTSSLLLLVAATVSFGAGKITRQEVAEQAPDFF